MQSTLRAIVVFSGKGGSTQPPHYRIETSASVGSPEGAGSYAEAFHRLQLRRLSYAADSHPELNAETSELVPVWPSKVAI